MSKINKIKGFKATGYNLRKVETQTGDTAKEKRITWHITINNANGPDLEMYLGEYDTVTKIAKFRNYKNQMVVVPKMGPKTVNDYMWSMASEVFNKFKEGDLFRPQHGLNFR